MQKRNFWNPVAKFDIDPYKQTKAQDDQAQKERNKSTKWSKTKINKQRDKMVKYNPQIQTHDVNKKIHQNNNQHNDALTVGHQNVHIQPTKYILYLASKSDDVQNK